MSDTFTLRGDAQRAEFARTHTITCIGHLELLSGQTRRCCCGRDDIGSSYMVFRACPKGGNGTESFTFTAGPSCGRKIAMEAGIQIPPLVSLFTVENTVSSKSQTESKEISHEDSRSDINKEIMTVISILFTIWGSVRNKKLIYMLELIQKYPTVEIFKDNILALNESIIKTADIRNIGHSIYDVIEYYACKNHKKPRQFKFEKIKNFINTSGDQGANDF